MINITQAMILLDTLERKDIYTFIHSQFTAKYAVELALKLNLNNNMLEDICYAGLFHDIGKVFITNDILRKNTELNKDEYSNIKNHVANGLKILDSCNFSNVVMNAIMYHHERWDGNGYPYRIPGKNTPIEGRILQIADAFSAMTVKRTYRNPLSIEDAILEIKKNSGTQFDPQLTKVFIDMLNSNIAVLELEPHTISNL